ncbi:hypothetical protein WA026_004887 [Henosepilachna vigintioctopunctata]|uniref:Pre-mRNA-processing factor 39 n=1 Tax=Henosepilachna vigintioctopunctata TaxID=420089 RepID=A0AAW1UWJ2_9CUCU
MDAGDDQKPVRRTRSAAKTLTSPQVTPSKPTTRKTKKKVVVMEVEVSDEEDVACQDTEKNSAEKEIPEPLPLEDESKVEDNFFIISEEESFGLDVETNEKNKSEKDDENDQSKFTIESQNEEGLEAPKTELEKIEIRSESESIKQVKAKKKTEALGENDIELDVETKKKKEIEVDVENEIDNLEKDLLKNNEETKEDTAIEETNSDDKSNNLSSQEKAESVSSNGNIEDISEQNESKMECEQEIETSREGETMDIDTNAEQTLESEEMKQNEHKDLSTNEEKLIKPDIAMNGDDPDTENISEDELPVIQAVKVPETEEVSDEELPGPKRAELPADTEVVSEDELPTVKKEGPNKRKLTEGEYDPCSPTSETEVAPTKKIKEDKESDKEKDDKSSKPKKLPELDKFWKAVNDDPTDFTGWTYLLQYVDQENDMEAAREAYDAFLSHYPYCYGYWRKYADYEKRKGNKKKCEEVFERGLKAIPLSVDLWIHYLNYVKSTRQEDEEYIRSQFDRAIAACGLEFRSDRFWDSYIKWESEGKRLQRVTAIFDKLLSTPTQGYTAHFESFQEHVSTNPPNKVLDVDEFLALRKEVKNLLKNETTEVVSDAPPGDEDPNKLISSDEESKLIRERIISIRRKIHKNTVTSVSARWNFEEGIKRPYFHVKPLERCQLKNWQDYLDFEIEQGDKARTIVLFERCLIACALYEEFWLKFIHYLNSLKDDDTVVAKIKDVYERACTIHHLKKPNLHLQWAMFEESHQNANRAAEILVNLERCVPNLIQIANRRISLERRRGDYEKCCQLFEHYINNSKNKLTGSYHAIRFSRFQHKIMKNMDKSVEILKNAIVKDPTNPRLYLQLVDLTLQKDEVSEKEIVEIFESFLEKDSVDIEQKVLFAQRKLEYLEDFGCDTESIQKASEDYQKILKQSKESSLKRKDNKSDASSLNKKEKSTAQPSTQTGPYGPYGSYNPSGQGSYQYSGTQAQGQYNYQQYGQNEQYTYQNWQYPPQGGYSGYNQWGSYSGGYGY